MSFRNGLVLSVVLSVIAVLAGCSSSSAPAAVAPPSGGFSDSDLSGTYVFSASGTDFVNGNAYAVVGSLVANGSGKITGGTVDMNDAGFVNNSPAIAPISNVSITSGSYNVGVDGRGTATVGVATPFGNSLTFDFVIDLEQSRTDHRI